MPRKIIATQVFGRQGEPGDKGDTGDVTPAALAAKDAAEGAASSAVQVLADTEGVRDDAVQARAGAELAASAAEAHKAAVEAVVATNDGIMATALADPESASRGVLTGQIDAQPAAMLGRPLDLWDEWTVPTTYAALMTQVNAALSGITADDRGVCSDGVNHVYAYTAGTGPNRAMLVGGIHGSEFIAPAHVVRFFQRFAKDDAYAALRQQFTIMIVACASPAGFNAPSRTNANAVDPNRNFDFYWDWFTPASPETAKGSAAFSEVEAQILRDLFHEFDPVIVLDVHNMSAGDNMAYANPCPWVHANRNVILSAVERTSRAHGKPIIIETGTAYTAAPTLSNWAAWQMRWKKGRRDAIAATIETSAALFTNGTRFASRDSMRMFGSLVTNILTTWFYNSVPERPYPVLWMARRTTWDDATDVSAGGTKLDSAESGNLIFNELYPRGTSPSNVAYVDVVPPAPGVIYVRASGYLISGGAGSTATPKDPDRVQVSITVDGVYTESASTYVTVPTKAGDRIGWATEHRITVTEDGGWPDAKTLYRLALRFEHQTWPGASHLVKSTRFAAEFIPQGRDTETPIPYLQ